MLGRYLVCGYCLGRLVPLGKAIVNQFNSWTDGRWIFQDDNILILIHILIHIHRTRVLNGVWRVNVMPIICCGLQTSRDLTPTEHLLEILDRCVRQHSPTTVTVSSLKYTTAFAFKRVTCLDILRYILQDV